jgi:hypothetical protein
MVNRVMSQLFFRFNPKLSEAAAWNPTKKSRGSSPPNSVSVAEFMVLPQVTLGTRSGAAGDPNEKPQAIYHFFTGLRRRCFTMVIQCINNYGGKYDSYNHCIQTMNEQFRI